MTVIVFSGSGMLYPAHIGAAAYLFQHIKSPIELCGTSGGSMVAAMLSRGWDPEDILDVAMRLEPGKVITPNWNFWQTRKMGLFSLDKVEKELRRWVPPTFSTARHPLTVVAYDVDAEKPAYFSTFNTPSQDVALAVKGSIAVPCLFEPVEINGHLHVDGGIADNLAVENFPKAADVYAIKVGPKLERKVDPVDTRTEFISRIFNGLMYESPANAKIVTINPPYGTFDIFGIKQKDIGIMYEMGYDAAEEQLKL